MNMRSNKSRSRSKSNRNNNNNNRSVGNVMNRVFDSSGPEGKVRGTPQQIIEKYQQLTNDAQLSGDRVAAENFKQHAEHYTRILSEAQREADERREQHDKENREKQAQRDQERVERQERDAAQRDATAAEQPATGADLADSTQPDMAPFSEAGTSDLVETPEAVKAERPKPRRKRPAPKPKADLVEDAAPMPDAPAQD